MLFVAIRNSFLIRPIRQIRGGNYFVGFGINGARPVMLRAPCMDRDRFHVAVLERTWGFATVFFCGKPLIILKTSSYKKTPHKDRNYTQVLLQHSDADEDPDVLMTRRPLHLPNLGTKMIPCGREVDEPRTPESLHPSPRQQHHQPSTSEASNSRSGSAAPESSRGTSVHGGHPGPRAPREVACLMTRLRRTSTPERKKTTPKRQPPPSPPPRRRR